MNEQQFVEALKEKGIELTDEQLQQFKNILNCSLSGMKK